MKRYVNVYGTYFLREGKIVKRISKGGVIHLMFRDEMKNEYPIEKTKLEQEMNENDWRRSLRAERELARADRALRIAKDKIPNR